MQTRFKFNILYISSRKTHNIKIKKNIDVVNLSLLRFVVFTTNCTIFFLKKGYFDGLTSAKNMNTEIEFFEFLFDFFHFFLFLCFLYLRRPKLAFFR